MDWLKAWRWSSLRIHNNLIFVLRLTCITKVTPLLRHMHTSSTNAQKGVFFCLHLASALFIHPLLPFLQHLSIPFEESGGNTRIQQRPFFKKKKTEAKHVSSNTPSYPPPWACSAPLQQCASTLFEAKKGGRKSGGVQQLRAQGYSTKMNRTEMGVGGGGRSLTRREQHNLINTNARSKLFKRASNSALTC